MMANSAEPSLASASSCSPRHALQHFAAYRIDRDERHRLGVVDMGEAAEEGVVALLHRSEETKPQVIRGLGGKEGTIELLVFRPDRADVNRPAIRQDELSFPLAEIDGHGARSLLPF